ncbi:MAG: hypothetical protein GX044_03265 [Firmicutes bacterium]|nr:hypothetical protein [Bacillota bacterium]
MNELKAEGLSEDAAIDTALERFGEEKQLTGALGKLFKTQKIKKRLFWAALVIFLIGLGTLVGFYFRDLPYAETFALIEQLEATYREKTDFTAADRQELQSMIERKADLFANVGYLVLYRIPEELQGKIGYSDYYEFEIMQFEKIFAYGEQPNHPLPYYIDSELFKELPRYGYRDRQPVGKYWYLEWSFIDYNYRKLDFLPGSLLTLAVLLFAVAAVMHGIEHKWFQVQRVGKFLLYASFVFLAAALATGGLYYLRKQPYNEMHRLARQLTEEYGQKEILSAEHIKELQALPQKEPWLFDRTNYFAVYRLSKQVEELWSEEIENAPHAVRTSDNLTLIYDDPVFVYGQEKLPAGKSGYSGDRLYIEWQFAADLVDVHVNDYKYSFILYTCFAVFIALLIAWGGTVFLSRKPAKVKV